MLRRGAEPVFISFECKNKCYIVYHVSIKNKHQELHKEQRASYHCWVKSKSTAHLHHLLCIISRCISRQR